MKVLELKLPEPTLAKLEAAAERLSVSPKHLAILSLEEKLTSSTFNSRMRPITC